MKKFYKLSATPIKSSIIVSWIGSSAPCNKNVGSWPGYVGLKIVDGVA